jgi:hypothetical protein
MFASFFGIEKILLHGRKIPFKIYDIKPNRYDALKYSTFVEKILDIASTLVASSSTNVEKEVSL